MSSIYRGEERSEFNVAASDSLPDLSRNLTSDGDNRRRRGCDEAGCKTNPILLRLQRGSTFLRSKDFSQASGQEERP